MKLKHAYWFLLLFWNILLENFSKLTAGMEILEEYADEESPYTERNNFDGNGQKRKWENSESSRGAKSDFDGKISEWGKI